MWGSQMADTPADAGPKLPVKLPVNFLVYPVATISIKTSLFAIVKDGGRDA